MGHTTDCPYITDKPPVSERPEVMGDQLRLTSHEREVLDKSLAGGFIAYVNRLADGHWPTFGEGAQGPYRGVCRCGEVMCTGWVIAVYRRLLIDSYEAKIEDFAAETRRGDAAESEIDRLRARLAEAEKELHDSRMALWKCAEIAGADLDGDETYKALKHPSVEQFATDAVTALAAYDEARDDAPA